MPVVPVESTVCVRVKIRGFGVVKEKKKKLLQFLNRASIPRKSRLGSHSSSGSNG